MNNKNLYLIDEDQMEKLDELITEFQSLFLDIYSNHGVQMGNGRLNGLPPFIANPSRETPAADILE